MIKVSIEGNLKGLLQKLNTNTAVKVYAAAVEELKIGALEIQGTAKKSIQKHSAGKRYGNHTASKPGDAPNTDTGRLVQSIQTDMQGLVASVGTNLTYGKYLEYGTKNIEPRPWLQPALDANENRIEANFIKAIRKALNKK